MIVDQEFSLFQQFYMLKKLGGVLGTLRLPKNYLKIFLFQTTKILFFLILIFNHKQDLVLKCSAWVSLWIKV